MAKEKAKETKDAFQVPTLKKFEIIDLEKLDPEEAEKKAQELREETLPELREQVSIAIGWLEGIASKSREAQEILAKAIRERKEWLKEYLENEFGPYRRTAWLALLTYSFSKNFKSKEKAQACIAALCQEGRLKEENKGPLEIFGKRYAVNEAACLGEPEIRQIKEVVRQLQNRVANAEKLRQQEKLNAIMDKGNLSTAELLRGKPGLYSMVPTPNGNYHPEGALLVKSDGDGVFCEEAAGSFQEEMAELKKLDKFLLIFTLNWEKMAPDFFARKGQFTKREAELMWKFWKLVRSGITWRSKKEMVQAQRNNCIAGTNITPKEFFEGKTGTVFLEHDGFWDGWLVPGRETRRIYTLFFQIERREENGQRSIGLTKFPPWLNVFSADCQGYFPEENLPENLHLVLKQIQRQEERRLQVQNHT